MKLTTSGTDHQAPPLPTRSSAANNIERASNAQLAEETAPGQLAIPRSPRTQQIWDDFLANWQLGMPMPPFPIPDWVPPAQDIVAGPPTEIDTGESAPPGATGRRKVRKPAGSIDKRFGPRANPKPRGRNAEAGPSSAVQPAADPCTCANPNCARRLAVHNRLWMKVGAYEGFFCRGECKETTQR